jgi:hypothetical protein
VLKPCLGCPTQGSLTDDAGINYYIHDKIKSTSIFISAVDTDYCYLAIAIDRGGRVICIVYERGNRETGDTGNTVLVCCRCYILLSIVFIYFIEL